MKAIILFTGAAFIAAINFMLYCCMRVASEEDARLELLEQGKM